MDKAEIRRQILQQRNKLDRNQLNAYSKNLSIQIKAHHLFKTAQNIASYLPFGKEISTVPIHRELTKYNKHLFVPKIIKGQLNQMLFCEINSDTRYKHNQFGIKEPDNNNNLKHAKQMDLILLPLVAFDKNGNRLGMGGGYYDRALSFRRNRKVWRKPVLLGLAYDFQQVNALPKQTWDIPLDGIVTNSQFLLF